MTEALAVVPLAIRDDAATAAAGIRFEKAADGIVRVWLPEQVRGPLVEVGPDGISVRRGVW